MNTQYQDVKKSSLFCHVETVLKRDQSSIYLDYHVLVVQQVCGQKISNSHTPLWGIEQPHACGWRRVCVCGGTSAYSYINTYSFLTSVRMTPDL